MKITTKTGDNGETGLFGGKRVSKDSNFIDVLGELDEIHSFLGWCRCESKGNCNKLLARFQDDIYKIQAIVGFEMKCPKTVEIIEEDDVGFLEKEIEKRQHLVKDLQQFIRPGSSELAARLHIARAVCRRVERAVVRLQRKLVTGEGLSGDVLAVFRVIIKYLNRLSDLLFLLAYEFEKEVKKY